MSPASSPSKLRFSDVVYAIDTTPKSLRKWLQNNSIHMVSDRGDGWYNFTYLDVGVLAIIRQVANFGFTIAEANEIVASIVADMFPANFIDPSRGDVEDTFRNRVLIVWRNSETPQFSFFEDGYDDETPMLAYVRIDVGAVVSGALTRADRIQAEGEDDE